MKHHWLRIICVAVAVVCLLAAFAVPACAEENTYQPQPPQPTVPTYNPHMIPPSAPTGNTVPTLPNGQPWPTAAIVPDVPTKSLSPTGMTMPDNGANGNPNAATISEGNWWIIGIGTAVIVATLVAVVVIWRKRK